MKTILHLFKKDTAQQLGSLVFWALLLLLRLWIDTRAITPSGEGAPLGMSPMLSIFLVGAAFLVWIPCVMADPLGNHETFYRTRPLRHRDILWGKLFFLTAWITLPLMATEALYLLHAAAPASIVVAAMGERFLFTTLFGLAIGAHVTGFRHASDWVKTILAAIPAIWLGNFLLGLLAGSTSIAMLRPTATTGYGLLALAGVWALAAGFYAKRAARVQDRWPRRYALSLFLVTLVPLSSLQWQARLGAIQGHGPQPTDIPSLDPDSIQVQTHQNSNDPQKLQVQVTVQPDGNYDTANVTEWQILNPRLTSESGPIPNHTPGFPPTQVFGFRTHSDARNRDIEAIASLVDEDMQIVIPTHGQWPAGRRAQSSLTTSRTTEVTEQPLTVQGTLRGRRYTWNKVGEMPLQSGADLKSPLEQWRFLKTKTARSGNGFSVELEWRRPALQLSTDGHRRQVHRGALTQHEYLLVQPDANLAYAPEGSYENLTAGVLTGYTRKRVNLQFQHTSHGLKFPTFDPSKAVLMVFTKNYIGEFNLAWKKPNVVLANARGNGYSGNLKSPEKMPQAEFNKRLDALGPVPANADRSTAGQYLYEVIKLVQARDKWIQESHALAAQLAPLVAAHPEMFLDGLLDADHRASQLITAALHRGLNDSHREAVFARLTRQPMLATYLIQRDWIEAGRDAIIHMVRNRTHLPLSAFQAAVLLDEPTLYNALVQDFERSPTLNAYEALRTIPEVASALDQSIRSAWERRPRILALRQIDHNLYTIALRHGMKEPLEEIYQSLRWLDDNESMNTYGLARPIQDNVELEGIPKYERNDYHKVIQWLRQRKPEQFRYHPARRRFFAESA